MCEATTDGTPTVVLKYIGAKGGTGVAVVGESVITGKVVGNVEDKLNVDSWSDYAGDGCKDEYGV